MVTECVLIHSVPQIRGLGRRRGTVRPVPAVPLPIAFRADFFPVITTQRMRFGSPLSRTERALPDCQEENQFRAWLLVTLPR